MMVVKCGIGYLDERYIVISNSCLPKVPADGPSHPSICTAGFEVWCWSTKFERGAKL